MWIEPATITSTVKAATLANKLIAESSAIKKYAKRFIKQIKNGKIILPIFGAGGVGKSTTGKILVGSDPLEVTAAYSESWTIEPLELEGDTPGTIFVAPGQLSGGRADRYWPELVKKVNSGKALGVVNVVSYGYHSFSILSYKDHELYKNGMNIDNFMEKYTEHRRNIELDMLDYLLKELKPIKKNFYMITLVSKQDLWWSKSPSVKAHYLEGDYGRKIQSFKESLVEKNFHHEFIPASLTVANLVSPTNETLALTSAGYDNLTHIQYLQNLLCKLHDMAETHQVSK